jgi:hypothetical protein
VHFDFLEDVADVIARSERRDAEVDGDVARVMAGGG